MTMRRIDRKRLFEAEKLGKTIDPTVGIGMQDALVSATQHREGHKVITDLVFDVGTSKGEIKSGGTTADLPCGETGTGVSYLCKVTDSVFGTVTAMDLVCLEAASDGVMTDYNFVTASGGDGYLGSADGTSPGVMEDTAGSVDGKDKISTVGNHTVFAFDADDLSDKYIYLAVGDTAGDTSSAATASITVDDTFVTGQLDSGVSRIVVIATDGTVVEHIFQSGTDKAASSSGTIGYGGTPSLAEMATSIATAINDHGSFTASATDKVVSIDQDTAGVNGNTTIALVNGVNANGAALSADLTIDSFSGGTTKGTSTEMSSGKFLMRFTGFVAPSDI